VNLNHNIMPFIYPRKPLWESRVALVTTGGVHLSEQPRFDINDPLGDCSYREIPTDACALTWMHAYYAYDRGADLDSVFPLRTLRGLATEGAVGEPNRRHFSFMGAIHDPRPLVERTAPEVARKVAADGVDAVLLTPS
jgi:D-proline reductase (dithiol) PrdB